MGLTALSSKNVAAAFAAATPNNVSVVANSQLRH